MAGRGNQARLCIFLHRGPCDGVTCPVHQVSIQSKLLSVRFPLRFSRWPSHGMKVVVHSLWKKRQKRGVPTFRGELGFRGSEQKVPLMELPCPPILASLPLQTSSKLTRKMDYSEKLISPSDNLIYRYYCPRCEMGET